MGSMSKQQCTLWLFNSLPWYKWPVYSEFSHKKWWFSIAMLVYQRVSVRKPSKDEVFIVLWWCLSSQLVLPQKNVRNSATRPAAPQVCRRSWPGAVNHETRKITRLQWHRIGKFAHIKKLHLIRKLRIRFAVFFHSQCRPFEGPT